MKERLQKIITSKGIASRRAAERMIVSGKVRVNGIVAYLGDKADPETDCIEYDGTLLQATPDKLYIMLNKPRGFVTTMSDEKGRKTVQDLTDDCGERVYPVGRLDLNSEGLLIMTNDGELANRLTHPSFRVDKHYLAWVTGDIRTALPVLSKPIELEGQRVCADSVRVINFNAEGGLIEVVIHEGKNRQVRRMCLKAGLKVTRLKRVAEGDLTLGDLAPGKWRSLTDKEVRHLFDVCGLGKVTKMK